MRNKDKGIVLPQLDAPSSTSCAPTPLVNERASVRSRSLSAPSNGSLDIEGRIECFGALFTQARNSIEQAALMFVAILDESPDGYERVMRRYPDISRRTLERLEAIGRGRVLPQLALDSSYGASCLQRLPVSVQKEFVNKTLPVVKCDPEGGVRVEHKSYKDLSVQECRQVFGDTNVRTEAEQKQYAQAPRKVEILPRYEIDPDTGEVLFHEGCRMNAVQLEALVNRLKEQAMKELGERFGAARNTVAARAR